MSRISPADQILFSENQINEKHESKQSKLSLIQVFLYFIALFMKLIIYNKRNSTSIIMLSEFSSNLNLQSLNFSSSLHWRLGKNVFNSRSDSESQIPVPFHSLYRDPIQRLKFTLIQVLVGLPRFWCCPSQGLANSEIFKRLYCQTSANDEKMALERRWMQ